ncbi:MAG: hypothetical protein FJ057_07865 [Cyanobacteria bacterium K_DeepCast_0m_m1_088]|nr:hypothetical protein [Cyanobacteria bacterium K_DeepCast_0m_m1_088]
MRLSAAPEALVVTSRDLEFNSEAARQTASNYKPISLGLQTLNYGVGGGNQETSAQTLRFTVTQVPERDLGQIIRLAGNAALSVGDSLTLSELQGLQLLTDADALSLSASQRLGVFSFSVTDRGQPVAGPEQSLEESLSIYVSGNAAASQAMEVLLALMGENPDPALLANYIGEFEEASKNFINNDAIEQLDTSVYSKLDPSNPLYMKRAGGTKTIAGNNVNYIAGDNPFNFSFEIDAINGVGIDLDPKRAGRQTLYSINYDDKETEVVNEIQVRHFVEASPLGSQYDRYFKYISEQVLKDYGAKLDLTPSGGVQYNDEGELLFTWDGVNALTADGKPLTTLHGEVITAPGYYDFTRLGDEGDGAVYRYSEPDADGNRLILGVDIHFTDNMFGDNSVREGTVVDPAVPVEILPTLGNGTSTNYAGTGINMVIPNFFGTQLPEIDRTNVSGTGTSLTIGPGGGRELIGSGDGAASGVAAMALIGGNATGRGVGGEGQPRPLTTGLGLEDSQADGDGLGAGGNGKQAGPGAGGLQAMALGDNQRPSTPRARGMALQPLLESLAAQADAGKPGSFVLSRIQEGSLMGNHLLDALVLGVGVVYGLYAPDAATLGGKGVKGLMQRIHRATGRGQSGAILKDQRVISVFAIKLEGGIERLVAARVSSDGLTVLAQQDLPTGMGVDTPGGQAQVDFSTRQLLERVQNSGLGQADQVLIDPRLQNQASLMQGMGNSTDVLVTGAFEQGLTGCTADQRRELEQWIQNPSTALPESNPMNRFLRERAATYAKAMPPQQASIATMVELGIALAASAANVM